MTSAWIVTDGKPGDIVHCLGVVERLGFSHEIRQIAPRPAFSALPWGIVDPREACRADGPLAAPLPDIAIASGRRTLPYLRAIKSRSGGRCFTVYLKDPRVLKWWGLGSDAADFIWAPSHDRLAGPNVLSTPTSPHRLSPERIAAARAAPDPRLVGLPGPRIAILLGGDSRNHRFEPKDIEHFGMLLGAIAGAGGRSLMASPSRRTPPALAAAVRRIVEENGGFFWDGSGENPYLALVALADHLIVTADSVNMIGEALASGAPVHIFEPTGGTRKTRVFLTGLLEQGLVRRLTPDLQDWPAAPVDATTSIAHEIERRFALHRAAIGE